MMKPEAINPASRLAIARRQPGANLLANEYVRGALTDAGYGALPLSDRGLLFDALTLVMQDDAVRFGGLVSDLRDILERAEQIDRQAEFKRLGVKFKEIKGCPECHRKPDIEYGHTVDTIDCQRTVVCCNHDGYTVAQTGQTIDDAITSWNRDDWIDPGITRTAFAFE